jgi:hypothetical protein
MWRLHLITDCVQRPSRLRLSTTTMQLRAACTNNHDYHHTDNCEGLNDCNNVLPLHGLSNSIFTGYVQLLPSPLIPPCYLLITGSSPHASTAHRKLQPRSSKLRALAIHQLISFPLMDHLIHLSSLDMHLLCSQVPLPTLAQHLANYDHAAPSCVCQPSIN